MVDSRLSHEMSMTHFVSRRPLLRARQTVEGESEITVIKKEEKDVWEFKLARK